MVIGICSWSVYDPRYVLKGYWGRRICDEFFPPQYKAQGMCDKAVERRSYALRSVPDQYKTREMCGIATERNLYPLEHVPDQYKT